MSRVSLPMNENEYDDTEYGNGVEALMSAVADLWEAGASQSDIESEFENALANVA